MGTIGGDGEDGGGDAHQVSGKNHREVGVAEDIWDTGYSQYGSISGSGRKPVGNDLHQKTTGDCGTLGGVAVNFRGMRRGYGLWGKREQEGQMVEIRGGGGTN